MTTASPPRARCAWGLAACALAACVPVIPSDAERDITDADRACVEGDVCVSVAAGGCSCNSDGALTAVNEAATDAIDARRALAGDVTCNAAISRNETCCATGTACVDGRCELLGPRGRSLTDDCANLVPVDTPDATPAAIAP